MIHGSTQHAPRSFDSPPEPVKEKVNPFDVEEHVRFLRKKRSSAEFEIRSRSRKQSTIDGLSKMIQEVDREIESLGFPVKVKRGRKKKGTI